MKTGILFDLDGTLLNTLGDLADAVNYALSVYGYPARTEDEVRAFVGNGIGKLIQRAVPEHTEPERTEEVLQVFRTYYQAHCNVRTKPYPGVLEVLEQLREKYPVAVVSNKNDAAVKVLCQAHFPGVYALGERPGCPRKPAPDMLLQAMADLGVDTCVYVGDSDVDVETAANAGVPCVSVTWGFRSRESIEQAGGRHFCESVERLPAILEQLAEMRRQKISPPST